MASGDDTIVALVRTGEQLISRWRTHLIGGRPNCIVQEYIPGGPDTVWMVNSYYDASSTPLFAASGRKVRQHPASPGNVARTLRTQRDGTGTDRDTGPACRLPRYSRYWVAF